MYLITNSNSFVSKSSTNSYERRVFSESPPAIYSAYQQMMTILEQSYCLGDINSFYWRSNSGYNTSSQNSNRRVRNSGEQPNGSFQSSSSNGAYPEQAQKQKGPSSQPIAYSDNNKDWFNINNAMIQPFYTPANNTGFQ